MSAVATKQLRKEEIALDDTKVIRHRSELSDKLGLAIIKGGTYFSIELGLSNTNGEQLYHHIKKYHFWPNFFPRQNLKRETEEQAREKAETDYQKYQQKLTEGKYQLHFYDTGKLEIEFTE
ncbi:hypothetical protein HYU22_01365 [Candidatus Woesearchaeota archaeon]|nr:hypothetical protein [Candidatus Woesearchaeota archaeon]